MPYHTTYDISYLSSVTYRGAWENCKHGRTVVPFFMECLWQQNLFQRRRRGSGHYGKPHMQEYVPFICFLIKVGFDIPPPGELRTPEWSEAMQMQVPLSECVVCTWKLHRQAGRCSFPQKICRQSIMRKGNLELGASGLQEKCFLCLVLSLIKWEGAMQKHRACWPAGIKRRRGL